jgi:hypothetical protein
MKNLLKFKHFILVAALALIFTNINAQSLTNYRPYDKDGVSFFEAPKDLNTTFMALKVKVGGSFTQQYQGLNHENASADNPLTLLSGGFNLATANLNLDVQLADGVRLSLVTYLSSRHHPESWVKGGYIQFDKLPFLNDPTFGGLMDNMRIRVGHMEINYGDTHFRRTDNGNAIYNPFVGNYIMDAFNTEIGGEVLYQNNGLIALLGITGGEINGNIADMSENVNPNDDKGKRSPSWIGKLGYDGDVADNVRLRVTGSFYTTSSSSANHLFDGDRGGSRYYLVMAPPGARAGDRGIFPSGRWNPGFSDKVSSFVGNAFFKAGGFEVFTFFESAKGRKNSEATERDANQFATDLIYRFGENENVYIGGRYNTVTSEQSFDGSLRDISIDRVQLGVGWFITKNILAKLEYVTQKYKDFPNTNILHEGKFDGVMIEAVVGF